METCKDCFACEGWIVFRLPWKLREQSWNKRSRAQQPFARWQGSDTLFVEERNVKASLICILAHEPTQRCPTHNCSRPRLFGGVGILSFPSVPFKTSTLHLKLFFQKSSSWTFSWKRNRPAHKPETCQRVKNNFSRHPGYKPLSGIMKCLSSSPESPSECSYSAGLLSGCAANWNISVNSDQCHC